MMVKRITIAALCLALLTVLAVAFLPAVSPTPTHANPDGVTLRSVGTSPGANSTSCVITKPAGLEVGDLMVAQVVGIRAEEPPGTFTAPANWTSIRQDTNTDYVFASALFWKIADADDVAATNFTFTATLANSSRGAITAWYGHDPATPINANEGQANAASTTVTSDGLTPSVANCVICLFCGIKDDNTQSGYAIATSNPASWTEAYDLPSDLTYDLGLSLGYATRPETSATGNGTATTSGSDANIGQLVAIAPVSAGPQPPTNVAATDGTYTDKVVVTWTKSEGATAYQVYRDGTPLGWLGDVATYNDTGADAPTITPGNAVASDGSSTAQVDLSLSGTSANNGTSHTYKIHAKNDEGESGDSNTDTGYRGHSPLTYQWQKSASDSDAGYSNIDGATSSTYSDTAAPAPTITPGTASASDGTSSSYVTLSLSGESANNGAGRYYKCILNATGCTQQTSGSNRGYRGVGALTYQWQRSAGDSDENYSNIGGATTNPYNDTGAPADGSGRYYKCVENATGASQAVSTSDRGYRFVEPVLPTLITGTCQGFGRNWATIQGIMVDNGIPANCTQVGFDYGLTTGYGKDWTKTGAFADGTVFVGTLTGLSPASVYHYRAKAYNGEWGYGVDQVFNTVGSPTLYEYLGTGAAQGADIYGANWGYQQFTVGDTSHTVTSIRLYLKRTLSPGTVTVSLRHADDDDYPTGLDLCSATLNGSDFSTSFVKYQFDVTETSLEAGQSYAVVVRAITGDDDNDIQWKWNADGGLDDAVAGHSADGGLTWDDDSPADFLFEIWGYPCIRINSAAVFEDYLEEGDLLFVAEYVNVYPPYYPSGICPSYFYIQLVATNGTTVIAQSACPAWGNKPGSIYLSANQAAPLTKGSQFYIRLYGSFPGNPVATYQLAEVDWMGNNLFGLDNWVLATAHNMADYYDRDLTAYLSGREVLNQEGGVVFTTGINALDKVRPNLFQFVIGGPSYQPATGEIPWTEIPWEHEVGPDVAGVLNTFGGWFGMDGKDFGAFGLIGLYLLVACFAVYLGETKGGFDLGGDVAVGAGLAIPFTFVGAKLGLLHIAWVAVPGSLMALGLVYTLWLSRT